MEILSGRTIIDYKYKNDAEASIHEESMKKDGWVVEMKEYHLYKHYRMYSKEFLADVPMVN